MGVLTSGYDCGPERFCFSQALQDAKIGRPVTRFAWAGRCFIRVHLDESGEWLEIVTAPDGPAMPWTPTHRDLLADDWHLYEWCIYNPRNPAKP